MSNLEEHSIVTETNLLYFPDTILRIEKLVVFAFWKIWYIFFSKFPFVFALCGLIALSMPCVSLSKICSCCQVEKFSNKEKSKQDPPSFYILHGWTLMKVWVFPKSGLHWLGRKTSLGKKKKKKPSACEPCNFIWTQEFQKYLLIENTVMFLCWNLLWRRISASSFLHYFFS